MIIISLILLNMKVKTSKSLAYLLLLGLLLLNSSVLTHKAALDDEDIVIES